MKVVDPGHEYSLAIYDGLGKGPGIRLRFMKRDAESHPNGYYPGNVGHHDGTNIQEVLRALIDRSEYLDKQIPDSINAENIACLRVCLFNLEERAHRRRGEILKLEDAPFEIEKVPTCAKCGHIYCNEHK